MTEQMQPDPTDMAGDPSRDTPSPAEGDREAVERHLQEKGLE